MKRLSLFLAFACLLPLSAEVKPVPPPGVPVSDKDRGDLDAGLAKLNASIQGLRGSTLLPDIEIFHEAVRYALQYNEFFAPEDVGRAKELLREGQARADQLAQGQSPWTSSPGLVVRGYVSKLDKSVQPFGLVVPPTYGANLPHRWRVDTWFHGRNEKLSEVNFLWDRMHNPGEFTPPNTIVVHLYGRYCNANKLAGEVDLFEALAAVKREYPVDDNRIVVRGFSMGGAAVWHIAAHYAGLWAAAAPGAGFSETPEFLRVWAKETLKPSWWEQKLWHLYDATDYAVNFYNCPVVAYNGDVDSQAQAADVMERAMGEENMRLMRVFGLKTGHRYHPESKIAINHIIDPIAERGRDPYPRKIRFTTWTLKYNRMKWVVVDAMGKEWERARLDAEVSDDHTVQVRSTNVAAFTLAMGSGENLLDDTQKPSVVIDGEKVSGPVPMSDRSWIAHFRRNNGHWMLADSARLPGLHKRHDLQGPIDDAFLDSFVMVRPSGTPLAPGTAGWVKSEEEHAIREWRRQFRGEAQVRDDTQITDADIAENNLVLWGDPGSNKILARIADRLPVRWTSSGIEVGRQKYPAGSSALILIYPNPLNPNKYVVLNSGFTFREYDNLNNARQVPKLPDYAVVDTTTPADERFPGKIAAAGFFNEDWQLAE